MAKRAITVLTILGLLAAVGCRPRFATGAAVTATPQGNGHRLVWPAADPLDSGQWIASYGIAVDGTPIATVPGTARTCLLTGLAAGSHTVEVTATDSAGDWSGDSAADGRITGSLTVAAAGTGGPRCASTSRWGTTDGDARNASISADGRYVVFESSTTTLHPGDTSAGVDLFFWDRTTNAVTPITPGFSAADATEPDISPDGRYVVFQSARPDLVPGVTNARRNLFVWDRTTSSFERITDAPASVVTEPNHAQISSGGTVVSYIRGDLDPTQGGSSMEEVWTWRRATGANTVVTDSDDGVRNLTMSDDGRYLLFSSSTIEVPFDVPSPSDVYLHDRTTGTTVGLPKAADFDSGPAVISGDGTVAAYLATKWNAPAGTYRNDLTLWNRATGQRTVAGTWATEVQAYASGISSQGDVVSFQMRTGTPTITDSAGPDVFLWDRTGGAVTQVTDGARPSYASKLSGDGRVAVFDSSARFIPAEDLQNRNDVFAFDRTT